MSRIASLGSAVWQEIVRSAEGIIYGPEQWVDPAADCPHAKTCGGGCCARNRHPNTCHADPAC